MFGKQVGSAEVSPQPVLRGLWGRNGTTKFVRPEARRLAFMPQYPSGIASIYK